MPVFFKAGINMETYAVVQTGGKQYRVKAQDIVRVELLDGAPGSTVTLTDVLAQSDGKTLTIGTPLIKGASVTASIVKHMRDKKVISYKKKRRKSYARKVGHRQDLTVIKVESVG
jgi:large subunit ribosomal protein L21